MNQNFECFSHCVVNCLVCWWHMPSLYVCAHQCATESIATASRLQKVISVVTCSLLGGIQISSFLSNGIIAVRKTHMCSAPSLRPPHLPSRKTSASRVEDPGFESCFWGIFLGSSHTIDLKIGTPVATPPGAWRYRVSTGTGRPGVSILWLDEVERLICNFCFSVAACKIVWADPSLRYTSLLLGSTNKQTISQQSPPYMLLSISHLSPPYMLLSISQQSPPYMLLSISQQSPPYMLLSISQQSPPYMLRSISQQSPPYMLLSISQQSPQGSPQNRAVFVWLNADCFLPWRMEY